MNNSSKPLAVGVIGVGGMGGRHALNVHSQVFGAEVAAVMDMDADRADAVATECGGARVFSDGHKLIADPAVDAVVIASPDPTHIEFTLACLGANKPVLCEKPLAITADDARRVVDAEVSLGRRLVQVGFMRHYDAQHVAVKQAVDAGRVGRPILFKGFHRNEEHEPYVTSEGVIVNSAIHDLDSCRWFLGQEVEQVYVGGVTTDAAVGEDTLDLVAIHLSLTGGCLGMIETYVNAAYGYEVGVEVVGETGTVQTDPSEGPVVRSGRSASQPVHPGWLERFGAAYVAELKEWVGSLGEGGPTGPSAWDGYTSLLVAEACIRSMRSGSAEKVSGADKPGLYGTAGPTEGL